MRTSVDSLIPALGPAVSAAAREVVRDDETWLAVWDEALAVRIALLGAPEGKPSRRKVLGAAEAMEIVVDAAGTRGLPRSVCREPRTCTRDRSPVALLVTSTPSALRVCCSMSAS